MRAALDTNVLVSGLLTSDGPCGHILALAFEGRIELCVDERMLGEYETVLPRPAFGLARQDVVDALAVVRGRAEAVVPDPLHAVLPHEGDRPFLEVAAAAEAVLVTGNKRHYPKRARRGVVVVDCRGFLDLLREAGR